MQRIVVETRTGYSNIRGDRIEFDPERNMFFGYDGSKLVVAFDADAVMKIQVSDKKCGED